MNLLKKNQNNFTSYILTIGIILFCTTALSATFSCLHAEHFSLNIEKTNKICDFLGDLQIKGKDAEPGDEIAFFDGDGILCGCFTVNKKGSYGIIHVYGDDPASSSDEGASMGEILTVKVWDASNKMEYSSGNIQMSSGKIGSNIFLPSKLPPVWSDNSFFVLHIKVTEEISFGDIDKDGRTNIIDALYSLRLSAGYHDNLEIISPTISNLETFNRAGIPLAVYILNHAALVR